MITDIKGIISSGREVAYNAANKAMVLTYWHVGKRIVEQEQAGKERAKYGQALIEALADELTKDCLLYTSPSPRDLSTSRMPSSA